MDRLAFIDQTANTWTEVLRGAPFTAPNGVQYPGNWLDLTSPQEQAAIGLKVVSPANPPAAGYRITARARTLMGGLPVEVNTVEAIPVAELAAQLQAAVRARRWASETGGSTFNGQAIATDEKAQAKIAGLIALFDRDPEMAASDFEAQPGVWISLDQEQAVAVGVKIGRHVQAAFSRSKVLCLAIAEAEAAQDRAALLALWADIETGWPS